MIRLGITLFFFFFCTWANASTIIKTNQYGVLEYNEIGRYTFFPNINQREHYLAIETTQTNLRYTISDGSFLDLDITTGNFVRFNAVSGLHEVITPNSNHIQAWALTSHANYILQSYLDFENFNESPPEEFCYIPGTEVAIPCEQNNYNNLSFSTLANSSCSFEQNYLNNHGFNGHPTLSACVRPAEQASMVAGIGFAAACAFQPVSLPVCVASIFGVAYAAGNYSHTQYQCNLAYENARSNLSRCLDSPASGGGGTPGSGDGSVNPSNPPRQCYEVIQHGICTPGGCTYWSEIKIFPC